MVGHKLGGADYDQTLAMTTSSVQRENGALDTVGISNCATSLVNAVGVSDVSFRVASLRRECGGSRA